MANKTSKRYGRFQGYVAPGRAKVVRVQAVARSQLADPFRSAIRNAWREWMAGIGSLILTCWLSGCGGGAAIPTPPPQPTVPGIASATPNSGPEGGGTSVIILGSNFQNGAGVSFGGSKSTSVRFTSATQLVAMTPAHNPGKVDITVTNPDSQSGTLSGGFTFLAPPTITSLMPNSGPTGGGTSVNLTGTNFQSGATVTFGGVLAASVAVNSATQITAITPSHSAGVSDVTVTNPDRQSATLTNAFMFVYSSRTDLTTVQLPSPIPNVGNLAGANTIITDPDFSNRVVRVTDANTGVANRTWVTRCSGSADENTFNLDSTLFSVEDVNCNGFTFMFNPTTMQATLVSSAIGGGTWSRANAKVNYKLSGTQIQKRDFTNLVNPTTATLFDYANATCLGVGYTPIWSDDGGVSSGDGMFAAAFSNSGGQGTGVDVVVYKPGIGCRHYNTATGQVTGDWGPLGTVTTSSRYTIHNEKVSKDGNWLVIVDTTCSSGTCQGPHFWNVGTLTVNECGNNNCFGHWTEGNEHWINNSSGPMHEESRLFSSTASYMELVTQFPIGLPTSGLDQHQSWNNADTNDSVPFLSTTFGTLTAYPSAWYNEVMAVSQNGVVYRFCHTFNTGLSQRFATQEAIGSSSQDGRFFMWSSDWMGTLGSESGTPTCTLGTNCRGDVFVVALR